MSYLLEGLEPWPVWKLFEEISRIPRCSKHEEKIQRYIKNWATEHGLRYKEDQVGNVLITRNPDEGFEHVPPLLFQAHQDMVCEKTPESSHDFTSDPLSLIVDSEKVKAHNTSLGADNGLGMALAMALLIDESLVGNGKIEALFTVDEEAGFTGVRNLEADFFTAQHMINLDSEEIGVIIVSSAGGGGTTYNIKFRPQSADRRVGLKVSIDGLKGGHSGVDIHLPRYNANNLLAKCLKHLHNEVSLRLAHFEGGTRSNVIPRNAYAEVLVTARNLNKAIETVQEWEKTVDKNHEPGLKVSAEPVVVGSAAPVHETEQAINLISEIPFGPKSWSSDYPDLVQTSNNLGIVRTEDNTFKIMVTSRTSDLKDGYDNQRILYELGQDYRLEAEQREVTAGWKADKESELLKLLEISYSTVLGRKPRVTGIHGGLECSVIAGLKPAMEIVSVGPTIKYPHSPSEYVEVKGVDMLYKALLLTSSKMRAI